MSIFKDIFDYLKKRKEKTNLILWRKPKQSFFIKDEDKVVKITIKQVRGKQVVFSINARHDIIVHRIEIYQRILEDSGIKFEE